MIEFLLYDWNNLISADARKSLQSDIETLISNGQYWKNCLKYQTDVMCSNCQENTGSTSRWHLPGAVLHISKVTCK